MTELAEPQKRGDYWANYTRPEKRRGQRRLSIYLDEDADSKLADMAEAKDLAQTHIVRTALKLLFEVCALQARGCTILVHPRNAPPHTLRTKV